MPKELHHNTNEQASGYIAAALAIVAELNVPDDLREAAFTAAVNLVSSKQVVYEQADVSPVLRGLGMVPQ